MPTGTGLSKFQAAYPDRFVDVGIAEQHSVALATGLAMGGMRPVVALYSTFLQRAFDQTVHDVCQNDQPVLLAVDRAGLVGEDGTSHQGMFTLPAQRQLPNLVIASPEGRAGAAVAAPDGARPGPPVRAPLPARRGVRARRRSSRAILPIGRGEVVREGRDLLFVALRADRGPSRRGGGRRSRPRVGPSRVINARFAKPLDRELILAEARGKRLVVTFEESVVSGGFGSGVLEAIEEARLAMPRCATSRCGSSGSRRAVRRPRLGRGSPRSSSGLDAPGLAAQVRETLPRSELGRRPPARSREHRRLAASRRGQRRSRGVVPGCLSS